LRDDLDDLDEGDDWDDGDEGEDEIKCRSLSRVVPRAESRGRRAIGDEKPGSPSGAEGSTA